jgi:hypothetical protein
MRDILALFRRRKAAEAILADPVMEEAFEAARLRALTAIEASPLTDSGTRELAYHRLRALAAVKEELRIFIEDHAIEKARLDRQERQDKA